MSKTTYYAVRNGRKRGIFDNWEDCKAQVHKFKGNEFLSFKKYEDAEKYLNNEDINKNKMKSKVTKANTISIYVDGSYNDDYKMVGYGCVMVKNSQVVLKISNAFKVNEEENTWNIAGELSAVLAGVKWSIDNNYKKIHLYYDYTGIKHWADGSWSANKQTTANYAHDMEEYQKYVDIGFEKVKAHTGVYYNEMADDLAKKAVEDRIQGSD